MSTDYTRGYNKGRSTGERKADAALAAAEQRAQQAVERAERAEKQQGLGHCEDCAYWRQGDKPRHGWECCHWGICDAPRAAGTPFGAWWCVDSAVRDNVAIQTTPRFGCVVFKATS
jgi:hypothetical protein